MDKNKLYYKMYLLHDYKGGCRRVREGWGWGTQGSSSSSMTRVVGWWVGSWSLCCRRMWWGGGSGCGRRVVDAGGGGLSTWVVGSWSRASCH